MKIIKWIFVAAELKTLHEEFSHHQDKIDQFHGVLGDMDKGNIASMAITY